MAWLDDRIQTHPKIVGLSDRAHRAWINGLCYCSMHGTGGQLDAAIRVHRVPKAIVRELLRSGVWDEEDDGTIWVHDWQAHNESRDTALEQRRAADRERQRAHRERVRSSRDTTPQRHVTTPPPSRDASRDTERDGPRGRAPTRARDHDHDQVTEGPSSSIHADDDELLAALLELRPTPAQRERWTAAAADQPDRIRACLTKALAAGRNAAALLDTMIENGSHPLADHDREPPITLPHCPECGPIGLPPGTTLADHRRNVHGIDADDDPEPAVSTTTATPGTVSP